MRNYLQQLKEEYIHGLNDKTMLQEVIGELTARNNDEKTISKGVLAWAKRIEVQQVQAAILNDITESCQFDKVNMASKTKGEQARQASSATLNRWQCRYWGRIHAPQRYPAYGKIGKDGPLKKVCRNKRDHAVHELQVQMVQDSQDEEIETVSINLIYFNKNYNKKLITAHLEMQVGKNTVEIPYKIDTGSKGNTMPLYTFKKLFKDMTDEQLEKSITTT